MDQQHVDKPFSDQIGAVIDILGEETGAIQRKSDRKMAAEFKRVQISFAAVWDEITELRNSIADVKKEVRNLPTTNQYGDRVSVTLKNARAS